MIQLTPHTPSVRAQLVARRTYQRPLNAEGTVFETWEQTVDRVIGHQKWLWERARGGKALEADQLEELETLRYLIVNRAAFLSGRTMWLGGTEVSRRREASMVNCFGQETTFITSDGVRSFADYQDGDVVRVQDHLGAWKNAVVKSFGKQALYDIEFHRGRSSQKVRATRNHTWVLASGDRTNSLSVGDRIHRPADPMNSWDFYASSPLERLYWCYGFTFGDGSTLPDTQGVHRWSSVRLCSAKSQFADRFTSLGFSTSQPLSCKGDFVAHTGTYLKTLPDISVDGVDMVRAFVRGYLDADGAKSKNAHRGTGNLFHSIQVTGSETIKWVRDNFPAVGVYITSEAKPPMVTNYGERSGETVVFRLCTSFGSASNSTYSVHSITPSSEETVWCLQVEDTQSFTLPNGVTTGNCSFTRVETVYDVVDAFWLLLQGAGVGFEPVIGSLNGFSNPLTVETIRSARTLGDGRVGRERNLESVRDGIWTISIGDSAEAWAKSVGKILAGKEKAHTLVLDFSEIRAAGSRLGGYGWISSGDGPLHEALLKIAALMNRRVDRLLTKIDLLDLMNLLGTTLSSRRSAQIALMPAGDTEADEFAMAKKDCFTNGLSHRGQSNNSVMFDAKPSVAALRGMFATMVDAGGSEPGFVNMASAKVRAPWAHGLNPCFARGTRILTKQGPRRIESLVGEEVEVWDGHEWRKIDNFRVTGINQPMLKIVMQDGTTLRVTPAHRMVLADGTKTTAGEIQAGDALMLADVQTDGPLKMRGAYASGFMLGDGTLANGGAQPCLWLYRPKEMCAERIISSASEVDPARPRTGALTALNFVPLGREGTQTLQGLSVRKEFMPWCSTYRGGLPDECMQWDRETKCEFLAGLFDADGTALDGANGFAYQLCSVSKNLLEDVQVMLKTIGVRSCLSMSSAATRRAMPGGSYDCQALWRISVGQKSAVALAKEVKFSRLVSFADRALSYNVRTRAGRVVSVVLDGVDAEVFCCTVPGTHTVTTADLVTTGQCAEQLLANKGICNLSELVLPRYPTIKDAAKATKILARANYRQTCISLDDGILQRSWHEVNNHLHLCGVGQTGISQWLGSLNCDDKPGELLDYLAMSARHGAREMARELGMPSPKHVTTTKPSGTLSKVADCSEGVHDALGEFIVNTIMLSAHDPLVAQLQAANYRVRPHPQLSESMLVEVPIHFPGATGRPASAIEQLERYKLMMQCYVDSNCSITVSYSQDEVRDICAWLYKNWDLYVGVSFMPRIDATKTAEELGYSYLPQAVVTREAYHAYADTLLPVDLDSVGGNDLIGDECAGGACPVR